MDLQLIPRQYSVAIYENPDDVNYKSTAQIFVYGDRGFMYSISGKSFYKGLLDNNNIDKIFTELNINSIEGYISKAHARLMKMVLKNHNVELQKEGLVNNRQLVWVVVSRKDNNGIPT